MRLIPTIALSPYLVADRVNLTEIMPLSARTQLIRYAGLRPCGTSGMREMFWGKDSNLA